MDPNHCRLIVSVKSKTPSVFETMISNNSIVDIPVACNDKSQVTLRLKSMSHLANMGETVYHKPASVISLNIQPVFENL